MNRFWRMAVVFSALTDLQTVNASPPPLPVPAVSSAHGGDVITRAEPATYKRNGTVAQNASIRTFKFHRQKKAYVSTSFFLLATEEFPMRVAVSTDGRRIAVLYTNSNYDRPEVNPRPVLSLHDAKGKILKRFMLDDLLPREEVRALWNAETGSTEWNDDAMMIRDDTLLYVGRFRSLSAKHASIYVDMKTFHVVDLPPLLP